MAARKRRKTGARYGVREGSPPAAQGRPPQVVPLKFTEEAKEQFVREIRTHGTVTHAAEACGVCPETVRRRLRVALPGGAPNELYDPVFAAEFEEALEAFRDSLKQEAWRRGYEGWDERPVLDKMGNVVDYVHRYSDRMLELLLKRHDPEFRDKVHQTREVRGTVEVSHSVRAAPPPIDVSKLDDEGRAALRVVLRQLEDGSALPAGTPERETIDVTPEAT